jgi:GT2 family glycosyltransferase
VISIVTPWKDHPELRADYFAATVGAEVIVVDTSHMAPFSFAAACNEGLARANGEIVMFLNNDITATPGWLDAVRRDVKPGALYGVATDIRVVDGQPILYLEGWCIAAAIETWQNLGGWDAETFQRPYWEDVDLSWRATQLGIRLLRRPWLVTHKGGGNTTARTTPGAYDASEHNRRAFERKVRAARQAVAA